MSDNTLGRKRHALSNLYIPSHTRTERFAPGYVAARRAERAARYLRSRRRRVLELGVAVSLLFALLPLLILIATCVKLGSSGPILFRQKRHGKDLGAFEMMKFRSMYCDQQPDPSVTQATREDPRVTPIGRVIRRTSLDELPQLWNVIKGDMSLIGPRPHAIEHDQYYGAIVPRYAERFLAKPGMTGLAQVNGARGATPRTEDMMTRVDFDLKYLQTASLALDVQILLKTAKEVIGSDAAF